MNQMMLALSIAALLAIFVGLGWAMHWLWTRAGRRAEAEAARHQSLVTRLHAAELARDTAERALADLQHAETDTMGESHAALTLRLSEAETSRKAAEQDAERWRLAYEAVIREDRDDP
jgi:hypothetical protein